MPSLVIRRTRHACAADERGAVAIVIALCMTFLLVISGMVLDFGLVRVDRQVDQSAADAATTAGLYALGMGGDDPHVYPYRGVCRALRYLQQNDQRFAGVTDTSGTWTNGNNVATGNGCTDTALRQQVCSQGDKGSWAVFSWSGAWQSEPLQVTIQSGYTLTGSGWSEESLPSAQADEDDGAQGCDQLAVVITQHRKPGLGSLATSSDLVSAVRSVGRVDARSGDDAPAMLLLKRTGCPVLQTGGSGGGSFIHVYGSVSSDGKSQPGTIHSDSDGSGCSGGSNSNIFLGRASGGIVAYAAPLITNPSAPDPTKPGLITSFAIDQGIDATNGVISDGLANVYASTALDPTAAAAATKNSPTARRLVTRKPVDARYLSAVHTIMDGAQSSVFGTLTAANAAASGYTVVSSCSPASAITAAKVFIDCAANNGYTGTVPINSSTVVFNGRLNPSGVLSLPNATKVYVFGVSGKPAIELGTGATLSVHSSGNLNASGTACSDQQSSDPLNKAIVVVKDGNIKQTGGALQLCRTSVLMMGGQNDGCLPSPGYTTAPAPYANPCALTTTPVVGSGQLAQTGGTVDWTAPNQYDDMTLSNGDPDPAKAPGWSDPNGPEDLAFWSESGTSSSDTFGMGGGGSMHAVGVYMVPNADPFIIGGGASLTLTNAQYIASSIALNGNNTNISMRVDANAAVTMPKVRPVGLVR